MKSLIHDAQILAETYPGEEDEKGRRPKMFKLPSGRILQSMPFAGEPPSKWWMETWCPAVRQEDEADLIEREREKMEKKERAALQLDVKHAADHRILPEPEEVDVEALIVTAIEDLGRKQEELKQERSKIETALKLNETMLAKYLKVGEGLGLVKTPSPRSGKARKQRRAAKDE